MLNALQVFLSVLVPILGLISCTACTGPRGQSGGTVDDSWKLPVPHLREKSGSIYGFSQSDSNRGRVGLDSEIVFPVQNSAEFEGVSITAHSVCRTAEHRFEGQVRFKDSARFPISSLLPMSLLQRIDLHDLNTTACEFKLTGQNRNGSTHVVTIPGIDIAELQSIENLAIERKTGADPKLDAKFAASEPNSLPADRAAKLRFKTPFFTTGFAKSEIDLICDRFRNFRSIDSAASADMALDDLINGKILPERPTDIAQEPRTAFTRQRCRFVSRTFESGTGLPRISISAPVLIAYPLTAVKLSGSAGIDFNRIDGQNRLSLSGMRFFEIQIANPTSTRIGFRFPSLRGSFLNLQYHEYHGIQHFRSDTHPLELVVSLPGSKRQWKKDGDLIFEVEPGATVRLEAHIASSLVCPYINGTTSGFAYQISSAVGLRQYANWNSEGPDLDGLTVDVTPIRLNFSSNDGTYDGWSPSPSWIARSGDGGQRLGRVGYNMSTMPIACAQ